MGHLDSSSFILNKISTHSDGFKYSKVIPGLTKKQELLSSQIYDPAFFEATNGTYNSFNSLACKLKQLIKSKGNKANCWEDSVIIKNSLLEKGENPHNFQMVVTNENGDEYNHYSTVFGLKKEAKIENPSTWGTKAVIVDGWKGIVMKASDALDFFKQGLSIGKKVTKVVYSDADPEHFIKIKTP
jgi:hypothetical protein